MSIESTTPSPQQRQHWCSEQALSWSGLPVIMIWPTVFLEGFFLPVTGPSVRDRSRIELPFGRGKTSPVATPDVAWGVQRVTGRSAMSVREFVSLHTEEFGGRRS